MWNEIELFFNKNALRKRQLTILFRSVMDLLSVKLQLTYFNSSFTLQEIENGEIFKFISSTLVQDEKLDACTYSFMCGSLGIFILRKFITGG